MITEQEYGEATIASIGVGNMGGAIVEAWLNKNCVRLNNLILFDAHKETWNTIPVHSPEEASLLENASIILLAVKPQMLIQVREQYGTYMKDAVIISILAGTSLETIREAFPGNTVIRWMPNLALSVGAGVLGYYYEEDSLSEHIFSVHENLLSIFSIQKRVETEAEIDQITALSGSAPAFYYYFAQAMVEAAGDNGFSSDEAYALTREVFLGTAKLFEKSGSTFEELIQKVASRGGTTEAALTSFEQNNLRKTVADAVDAAVKRAQELSGT